MVTISKMRETFVTELEQIRYIIYMHNTHSLFHQYAWIHLPEISGALIYIPYRTYA